MVASTLLMKRPMIFAAVSFFFIIITTAYIKVEALKLQSHHRTGSIELAPAQKSQNLIDENQQQGISRRSVLSKLLALSAGGLTSVLLPTSGDVFAANAVDTEMPTAGIEMKSFVDPMGLFSLRYPKGFYTLRRSAEGDLPDAKTGQGRRGASIFTAGQLKKAEVIAVERFPVTVLLSEQGISTKGDLSNFKTILPPATMATLMYLRREKDRQGGNTVTELIKDSVSVSEDGKELRFMLRTEIQVQKPDLLKEQTGYSEVVRITLAKALLKSNDGNIMAVYASALQQDMDDTADGLALKDAVESFSVTDQSNKV